MQELSFCKKIRLQDFIHFVPASMCRCHNDMLSHVIVMWYMSIIALRCLHINHRREYITWNEENKV